jgi:hypothetical protein
MPGHVRNIYTDSVGSSFIPRELDSSLCPALKAHHDGCEPVHVALALAVLDLVCTLECVVDALHHLGHTVSGIQALVGVGLTRTVGVTSNLPARQVDGLQTSCEGEGGREG